MYGCLDKQFFPESVLAQVILKIWKYLIKKWIQFGDHIPKVLRLIIDNIQCYVKKYVDYVWKGIEKKIMK